MPIPRTLHQRFFAKWAREMAYVLGFFAADGNMIRNKRGAHFITFYNCDKDVILYVQSVLGSNHKIGTKPPHKNQRANYQLQIGSKNMFADLIALGMTPAKSKSLRLPTIPRKMIGDFVRGYFDGDGCVYFNRLKFSDRKNPRPILMVRFTSGSVSFLRELHVLLKACGVHGGAVRLKSNKAGYDLTLSHRDSVALFHLMYDNISPSGFYLERKKEKFDLAIRALYGGVAQPGRAFGCHPKGRGFKSRHSRKNNEHDARHRATIVFAGE